MTIARLMLAALVGAFAVAFLWNWLRGDQEGGPILALWLLAVLALALLVTVETLWPASGSPPPAPPLTLTRRTPQDE